MSNIKMKKCIMLFVVSLFIIGVMGCEKKEQELSQKIVVYYLKNHSYYGTALGEFYTSNHTKYDIKLVPFESEEVMNSQLTTEIAAGTGPDVVLTSTESELDIYKSIKSGNIEELSTYFQEDKSYHEEDYYAPIINGGSQWGGQYMIPFTYCLDVLYLDKEMLDDTGFTVNNMKDYGTMVGLLSQLVEASGKDKLSTNMFSQSNMQTDMVGRYLENSGLEILDENGDLVLDVPSIQLLMKYLKQVKEEYTEKIDILKQRPEFIFDNAVSASANGKYPLSLHMLRSIFEERYQKECIAFPWKNVNGEYQPIICDYGFINKNSNKKDKAYFLLRYLMDYEVPTSITYPLSVNRNNVEKELSMLQKKEIIVLEMKNGSNIMSNLLDEETKIEIEEVLENMGTAIVYNTGYYRIIIDHINNYLENEDLEGECVIMEKKLQRYMDE